MVTQVHQFEHWQLDAADDLDGLDVVAPYVHLLQLRETDVTYACEHTWTPVIHCVILMPT